MNVEEPGAGLVQPLTAEHRRLYRMAYSWCCDQASAADLSQEALLRALSRLAQLNAFAEGPGAPPLAIRVPRRSVPPFRRCAVGAAAALMLLAASFAAGREVGGGGLNPSLAALGGVRLTAPKGRSPGVLLHLASVEPSQVSATLQRARELLDRYQGRGLKVELVVNGLALDFLTPSTAPYAQQFAKLMRRHPNLSVVACGLTLAALHDQGQLLPLLEGVRVAPSAVREVVKRLKEGWTYVES